MADIPPQAIKDWHTVKPSSYAAFCVMCAVKDSRSEDVYLEQSKAEEYGIKKSAYYHSFTELEKEKWIAFSRQADGKKYWKLLKGFSANVENPPAEDSTNMENNSTNAENSMNVEKSGAEIPQTWNENSANVENPLEPLIRINISQKENTKQIVETSSTVVKKEKNKVEDSPEQIAFRRKLWQIQNAYAKPTKKGVIIENNNAIRKLFKLSRGDTGICIEIHEFLRTEAWRKGRVTWIEVEQDFNFHQARIESQRNGVSVNGNSNGMGNNGRNSREQSAINRIQNAEQVRARVNARRTGKL